MSKLDQVDEDLSAPKDRLDAIVKTVSSSDINAVLASDIPLESKRSQLAGLVSLLEGSNRDELLAQAKKALNQVDENTDDPIIPQITS